MSREQKCPECGTAIEASHPDRRVGSAWQRGEEFGYWKTLLMGLCAPHGLFERIDVREGSVAMLRTAHCALAGLVIGCGLGGASVLYMGWSYMPQILLSTAVFVAPGACVVLLVLCAIERAGIRAFGRVHGRRISGPVSRVIIAHAAAGWVGGACLLFLGLIVPAAWMVHTGALKYPSPAGPLGIGFGLWMGVGLPSIAAFLGLLWFELLVFLGVRRCQYANPPGAAEKLRAVDGEPTT